MVKNSGFAPAFLGLMPSWWVRLAVLRLAIRGRKWESMDRLLEANLVEHRLQAALDAPNLARFSEIVAATTLLGGGKSPASISGPLLYELAEVIPHAAVTVLPDLGHPAPEESPGEIAAAVLAAALSESAVRHPGS